MTIDTICAYLRAKQRRRRRELASRSQVDLVAKRFDLQRISCLQLINLSMFPLWIFLPAPLAYGIAVLRGDLLCKFGYLFSELDRSYFSREEIICTLKRVFGDQLSPEERSRMGKMEYSHVTSSPFLSSGILLPGRAEIEELECAHTNQKSATISL